MNRSAFYLGKLNMPRSNIQYQKQTQITASYFHDKN